MKNEITKFKDLKGKTIVNTKSYCGDLWVKFSDNTFAVFVVNDITKAFGWREEEVSLNQYSKDKSEITLVELGLITRQEYEEACEEEELMRKKMHEEQEIEEEKRVKEYELKQFELFRKKYNK
jgi:hypothetical protein